ncbi:O-antigen ligase family protein [Olsenella sp. An290]|uniref:O-antigen ligase family protein n=1 Tax=Olsenella sp. An290 TaxID=1965625 RepID=UPI000B37E771|nr:O-antigen ligase family protein [Olsenella sp. An290]OUO34801.1 hypothetical protein B5F84_05375 [Olsenella sp. An290]
MILEQIQKRFDRISGYFKSVDLFSVCMAIYIACYPFEYIKLPGGVPITRIMFLLVGFSGLLCLKRIKINRNAELALPLLLVVLLAWNVPHSQQSLSVAVDSFIKYVGNIALVILSVMLVDNSRQIKLLAGSYVASSMVMLVFYYFNSGSYATQMESTRLVAAVGENTTDPNTFCLYFIPGLSYSFCKFLNARGAQWCALSIAFLLVPLYSGSRGALIAYAATIITIVLFALIIDKNQVRTIFLALLVFIIILAVLGIALRLLPEKTAERFSLEYILAHGDSGRSFIRENLWENYQSFSLLDQLFGKGLRSTLLYSGVGLQAHNFWLETLIDLGIAGLVILLSLHWIALNAFVKSKSIWLIGCLAGIFVMELSLSLNTSKTFWILITLALLISLTIKKRVEKNA